jgi:hypothetical protein
MRLRTTLAALAAALALLSPAMAQSPGRRSYSLQSLRDLDETSFEYCRFNGTALTPNSSAFVGNGTVQTVGSSTTVTAETANTLPFGGVSVGDELQLIAKERVISTGTIVANVGDVFRRVVTAKASGDEVTVNAAVDLTSADVLYRKLSCGTTATSGWIPTEAYRDVSFAVHVDQINTTTGVTVQIECENIEASSSAITLWTKTYTTATDDLVEFLSLQCDRMRFGSKMTSTDDGSDAGAAAEQISIYFRGRKEQ